MTLIKLCGMMRPEDITVCNRLHPDYAGFVFWDRSKRCVSVNTARALIADLDEGIVPAGVFRNQSLSEVISAADTGIRMIQLHGSEDQGFIDLVKEQTGLPVIKAFTVTDEESITESLRISSDHIMYDSGAGSGVKSDWSLLRNIQTPYFLAGGLDAGNVEEAIKELHPYAVDVSSGIETDGRKDPAKMEAFTEAVRRADLNHRKEEK